MFRSLMFRSLRQLQNVLYPDFVTLCCVDIQQPTIKATIIIVTCNNYIYIILYLLYYICYYYLKNIILLLLQLHLKRLMFYLIITDKK